MKRIIFLIVFCFVAPIFAVTTIEVVPRPVDGVVGTDKIVVRGLYEPNGNNIRIHVRSNGSLDRYYDPIILDSMANLATGYYKYRGQAVEKKVKNIPILSHLKNRSTESGHPLKPWMWNTIRKVLKVSAHFGAGSQTRNTAEKNREQYIFIRGQDLTDFLEVIPISEIMKIFP